MAFKTEAEWVAQKDALLADNTLGGISALDERTVFEDLKDSLNNMGTSKITTITSSQTLAVDTDRFVMVDPSAGDVVLELPDAASSSGKPFTIKRVVNGDNAVTVTAVGSDTIDGVATFVVSSVGDVVELLSDGGTDWREMGELTDKDSIESVIVIKNSADFGVIDPTKAYYIDGIIDMTGVSVEVPAAGISIAGTTFDSSQLLCSDAAYDMFTSPVGGSGSVFMKDVGITVDGVGSQVWNIVADTGFEAIETDRVNYNDCTKVGVISGYRQGLEFDTGRFGGTPSLELAGTWSGGFRIATSIVRSLSAGMTDPIFKAGAGFSMTSRFLTDINCDLPALAPLADFSGSNFVNSSSFQLHDCLVSRDGVFNPSDTNLLPNIVASDIKASFINNEGLPNTFVGARATISAATTTPLTVNVWAPVLGTFVSSDMQHFDSPANGQLRHLGATPREFRVSANCLMDGTAADEISVKFITWDDSASTFEDVPNSEQTRFIQNSQGGVDIATFTIICHATLDTNDYMRMEVRNLTNGNDIVAETSTFFLVEAR